MLITLDVTCAYLLIICTFPSIGDSRILCAQWFQMSELDEVSAPIKIHPNDFIQKVNVGRRNPWMPECEVQNK